MRCGCGYAAWRVAGHKYVSGAVRADVLLLCILARFNANIARPRKVAKKRSDKKVSLSLRVEFTGARQKLFHFVLSSGGLVKNTLKLTALPRVKYVSCVDSQNLLEL